MRLQHNRGRKPPITFVDNSLFNIKIGYTKYGDLAPLYQT